MLSIVQYPLFPNLTRVAPNAWLTDTLQKGRSIAFYSEKSRSEFIVAPVLLYCQEILQNTCTVYSGIRLDVDPEHGLKGECDYILAKEPPSPALRAPLMVVVEAKKNDIEDGLTAASPRVRHGNSCACAKKNWWWTRTAIASPTWLRYWAW